jgi:hypothetical protein
MVCSVKNKKKKHLFVVSLTSARRLTVWRTVSWKIMINSGIKGKIFTVVYNMHDNIIGNSCAQYLYFSNNWVDT